MTSGSQRPIGFVGLGNMGAPMARRLAASGAHLVLYDLRAEALAPFSEDDRRFRIAPDLAELGRGRAVVVTMLPDSDAVRAAALGDGTRPGFAEGLGPGGLVVDMSSSAPLATRALGEALAARGLGLVDAPVSGGVPRAREGTLTIMAGGETRLVDEVEPLLSVMGRVHRTGPLGSGHAMKALNNYVSAAGLFAVCEALIVARVFGLDPRVLNEVLKVSTGRNNTTDNKVEPYLLPRRFDSGFALDLMRKDVATAEALAEELDLDAPWLRACSDLLARAAQALGEGADHTAAFAFLERELTRRSGE